MFTLRSTTINNISSSSFSVSDVTDEHNTCPGLFTKLLFARLIAIYSSWKIYSMFPPIYTSISCNYCCVASVSPSSTCVTPGISRHKHPEGAPCLYIYDYVLLLLSMNAFERCSQFVLSFFLGSRSWSWWEWRERPVGTDTDGTPTGEVWLRPILWCKGILGPPRWWSGMKSQSVYSTWYLVTGTYGMIYRRMLCTYHVPPAHQYV